MKERRSLSSLILIICVSLLSPGALSATTPGGFKCDGCHKTLATVLPKSHGSYDGKRSSLCLACHKPNGKAIPLGKKMHGVHIEKLGKAFNDCSACHLVDANGKVSFTSLPDTHRDMQAMKKLGDYFQSWQGSYYLDRAHKQHGLYCSDCHQKYTEGDEPSDSCIRCHGDYEKVSKLAKSGSYEKNPHRSHFQTVRCTVCHSGHKEFRDFCSSCHTFGYKWTIKAK